MKKGNARNFDTHPPRSVDEGLILIKQAMTRAGLVGNTVTPAQMRTAMLESNLAAEIEKIVLTAGLPDKPEIPKEWGWPPTWTDALFYGDGEVVGLPLYNQAAGKWHIVAVRGGALMMDIRTGAPVCFDSPADAKANIDSYNVWFEARKTK